MVSVADLGPQWKDAFGPEPVVSRATMDVNSGRTPKQAPVFRGETRNIYPTPEYPDPSAALKQDPAGLMNHWLSGQHPYPPESAGKFGINRVDKAGNWTLDPVNPISSGVHWTESPQSIPERFTESAFYERGSPRTQPGKKLTSHEVSAMRDMDHIDLGDYNAPERYEIEKRVEGREKRGTQAYRDLGHREDPGVYKMGVIWHGKVDARHIDSAARTTDYEDEVILKPGGPPVPIHAMQAHMAPTGGVTETGGETHPIVRRAGKTDMTSSSYQSVSPRSMVPWSTVQFPEGERSVPIEGWEHTRRSQL